MHIGHSGAELRLAPPTCGGHRKWAWPPFNPLLDCTPILCKFHAYRTLRGGVKVSPTQLWPRPIFLGTGATFSYVVFTAFIPLPRCTSPPILARIGATLGGVWGCFRETRTDGRTDRPTDKRICRPAPLGTGKKRSYKLLIELRFSKWPLTYQKK